MNISQLDADVDFLCGSTSAIYAPTNKRRNQNIEYHRLATVIWESDGTWSFDDKNNTDAPIAYRTIANASGSYLIPTTAIRVEGVEVKNANSDWVKLTPVSYRDLPISQEEYLTGVGMPVHYQLEGNEIRLFPAPGTGFTTMSSGMAVRLSRNVTEIPISATTAEPGIPSAFHRMLSYAAAIDFTQDEQQRQFLALQKDRLEKTMKNFYTRRGAEYKSNIKPRTKKTWRQYL